MNDEREMGDREDNITRRIREAHQRGKAEGLREAGDVEINGVKLKYYDMLAWIAIQARADALSPQAK